MTVDFSDGIFTMKINEFLHATKNLKPTGGGMNSNSALDALMLAIDQAFRICPIKVISLITNGPPRIPDKET